jgi:hypothetical protein
MELDLAGFSASALWASWIIIGVTEISATIPVFTEIIFFI